MVFLRSRRSRSAIAKFRSRRSEIANIKSRRSGIAKFESRRSGTAKFESRRSFHKSRTSTRVIIDYNKITGAKFCKLLETLATFAAFHTVDSISKPNPTYS